MKLDQRLVNAAIDLMNSRFSKDEEAGAAAMYTESGEILTSVSPDIPNWGASLCHEVGALSMSMGERLGTMSIADEQGPRLRRPFLAVLPCSSAIDIVPSLRFHTQKRILRLQRSFVAIRSCSPAMDIFLNIQRKDASRS